MLVKEQSIKTKYVNLYSLNNKKIGIPIFQRFYAWRDDQVKQLLEDIKKSLIVLNSYTYLTLYTMKKTIK